MVTKETPNQICSVCLSILKILFDFKNQFEESQKKVFVNSEETSKKCYQTAERKISEVELIVGRNNFSLEDVVVVENNEDKEDYRELLKNLGKTVTVEYLRKNSDESINYGRVQDNKKDQKYNDHSEKSEDEEFETIIIKYTDDADELPLNQYECTKSLSSDVKISEKIKSLIIEGNFLLQLFSPFLLYC